MQAERLKILLELLEQDPADAFNWYSVAMEYKDTQPSEAIRYLEKLYVGFPEYLPTYYQLACLYAEQEAIEQATEVFEKGILLAQQQGKDKTLRELRSAFQLYLDEWE